MEIYFETSFLINYTVLICFKKREGQKSTKYRNLEQTTGKRVQNDARGWEGTQHNPIRTVAPSWGPMPCPVAQPVPSPC